MRQSGHAAFITCPGKDKKGGKREEGKLFMTGIRPIQNII